MHPGSTKNRKVSRNDSILTIEEGDVAVDIDNRTCAASSIPTYILPPKEFTMVTEELNTHLSDEEKENFIITKRIGLIAYTFEYHGYNDYRFLNKVAFDDDDVDIARGVTYEFERDED